MNITGIARENFEEAGLPLKNTIELTTKNEYTIPDIWGLKVGKHCIFNCNKRFK